jgi:hypothetical protein
VDVETLKAKLLVLSTRAWNSRVLWPDIERWLANFDGQTASVDVERVHALFLASHVMFFHLTLVRQMLKSVYRDLYRYPIVKGIREAHDDTLDAAFVNREFEAQLEATRFVGVGNPSESGAHLLYYFRQANKLSKTLFVDSGELLTFKKDPLDKTHGETRDAKVRRVVFMDDMLGSGRQLSRYLPQKLSELRTWAPSMEIQYIALFALPEGLERARQADLFGDNVQALFELDSSFQAFDSISRCFRGDCLPIDAAIAKRLCEHYGSRLWEKHPLGYENGQLLLAFAHNTPDNTLPVLWFDEPLAAPWVPLFERYDKKY